VGDVTRSLGLRRADWNQMREHVHHALPEEACGLVGGKKDISEVVYTVLNDLKSPVRFRMNALEQVHALLRIEESGLDLLAIYHSHPAGPAHPSQTDLDEFAYPGVPYLIWYLQDGVWNCHAFSVGGGIFTEIPFTVSEEE
jgi:[CysO sulfur-carrier protein]-S-L-cysteine hydrolase